MLQATLTKLLCHDLGADEFNAPWITPPSTVTLGSCFYVIEGAPPTSNEPLHMPKRGSRINRAIVLQLGRYQLRLSRLTHIITINTIERIF